MRVPTASLDNSHVANDFEKGWFYYVLKTIVVGMSILKTSTPLLMASIMNTHTGNIFCIIAQTYSKLVMFTHFNFKLPFSYTSNMYYDVFKEFLDKANENLLNIIFG